MKVFLDLIKLFKPKAHNTIAILIVVSGLSLISTPLIEKLIGALLKREYSIDITGENDVKVGLILVMFALVYHLIAQGKESMLPVLDGGIRYPVNPIVRDQSLPPNVSLLGRSRELSDLTSLINSSSPICLIEGFGGVGKTSLAIAAAYVQKNNQQFANFAWISAKGTELSLVRFVDELISILDKPYLIKLDNNTRQLELLSILSKVSTLIIIDNFESIPDHEKSNILLFLSTLPQPSKALITSRPPCSNQSYCKGIDLRMFHLLGLDPDYSMRLLTSELNRIGATYESSALDVLHRDLHKITEGNPLAIILSVSQLSIGYSLEGSIKQLTNVNSDIFEIIFTNAWGALSNEAKVILMAASLFSRSFKKETLWFVANIPSNDFDASFSRLVEISLVKSNFAISEEKLRFELHPLTKLFATNKLKHINDEEHKLYGRLAKYYRAFAQNNEVRFWEGREVFAPFDGERHNIFSVMEWCWANDQYDLYVDLTIAVADYLIVRGFWHQCFEYGEKGSQAARQLGRTKEEAWILVHMQGYLYANRLAVDKAESALINAVEILTVENESKDLSEAKRNLGRVYRKAKEFNKAKLEYHSALNLAEVVNDKSLIALALNEIGKLERDLGNYNGAKTNFISAISKIESIDNSITAGILCNLSGVEISLGEMDSAQEHSMDSLNYFTTIDNHEGIATAKWRLAAITLETDKEVSCGYAKDAYYLFHDLGMSDECEQLTPLITKTC